MAVFGMEKDVKQIFAKASIGASGAITVSAANSKGISSIVKESTAGQYTVTFGTPASVQAASVDKYKKVLSVKHIVESASDPAAPIMHILSNTVASDGKLVLQFLAPDGTTATNPASGEVIYFDFMFGDSTV
jgi:hypothetical protein